MTTLSILFSIVANFSPFMVLLLQMHLMKAAVSMWSLNAAPLVIT